MIKSKVVKRYEISGKTEILDKYKEDSAGKPITDSGQKGSEGINHACI